MWHHLGLAGTELIADYALAAGLRDAPGDAYAEAVMPVSAERGEPWLSLLAPGEMSALLESHGLGQVEHVRLRDAVGPHCGTGPTRCAPSMSRALPGHESCRGDKAGQASQRPSRIRSRPLSSFSSRQAWISTGVIRKYE